VSKAELLLDLQEIDLTIDRLTKRLSEVKEAQRETDELIAARDAARAAEQNAVKCRATRKDLELADAALDEKIKQAEKRLYSGLVKIPKELLDLQNDISSLRRQKATLDDQLLEAMVALEDAETALKQAVAAHDTSEAQWTSDQAGLSTERAQLERDLAQHAREQAAARAQLNQTDLSLYDQLRRRKGGLAVVELMGNACGGCSVRVTANVLQQLGQAEQLARCGNCERILVRS
jgi:predicted  nucleic acid-binding Zn-ribbon protein